MNSSMVCSSSGLSSVAHISATRDLSTQVRQSLIPSPIAYPYSEKALSLRFAQSVCPCSMSITSMQFHPCQAWVIQLSGEQCGCCVQGTLRVQARPAALQIENRVAIRFQRFGRKKKPFYRQASP